MGGVWKDRLCDLRRLSEQLCNVDQAFDIPAALMATGHLPYRDFPSTNSDHPVGLGTVACVTKSRRGIVVVCNILEELQEAGIVQRNQFVSTRIGDPDYNETPRPYEKTIQSGSGIFPESVGDYVR
jgi:hypothetical protein